MLVPDNNKTKQYEFLRSALQ